MPIISILHITTWSYKLDRSTKAIEFNSFLIIKEKQNNVLFVLFIQQEMGETSSKLDHASLPIHYSKLKRSIIGRNGNAWYEEE